jgi:hypothetical protein
MGWISKDTTKAVAAIGGIASAKPYLFIWGCPPFMRCACDASASEGRNIIDLLVDTQFATLRPLSFREHVEIRVRPRRSV